MEIISTHVLDTTSGRPAGGVHIQLFYNDGSLVGEATTNPDGRCDQPLVTSPTLGQYELLFDIGSYFRASGIDSPFLDAVPIRFTVSPNQSYHIPLLCSPWAYSTYRGS